MTYSQDVFCFSFKAFVTGRIRREIPLVWNFPYLLFSLSTPVLPYFPNFLSFNFSKNLSESSEIVTTLFLPNIMNQKINI